MLITEDGVEIFEGDRFIMVGDDFVKHKRTAFNLSCTEDYKKFKHESSADEYIWRNKPVFSYKDIQNYGVHPVNMIRVEQLAKERCIKKNYG